MGSQGSARRVAAHIRGSAVSYVALMLALGGTAYAATQVTSADIHNESILSQDLKNGQVLSADVTDNSVVAADLATASVTSSEIAGNAVTGAKIVDNQISGLDVNESTLGPVGASTDGTIPLRKDVVNASDSPIASFPGGYTLQADCNGPYLFIELRAGSHGALVNGTWHGSHEAARRNVAFYLAPNSTSRLTPSNAPIGVRQALQFTISDDQEPGPVTVLDVFGYALQSGPTTTCEIVGSRGAAL